MKLSLMILVAAVCAVAFVVEMLWIGWAVKHTIAVAPVWLSAVIVGSHVLTFLGVAALFDRHQAQGRM